MEIFFFWFVFAIVVGIIAANRNRSGFGWFMLSIVISPILAGILVLALGRPTVDPLEAGTHKKCHACAEPVLKEAIKCKHCGTDLSAPAASATQAPHENRAAYEGARQVGKALSGNQGLAFLALIGIVVAGSLLLSCVA